MSVNPSLQNLSAFVPLPPGGQSPDLGDPAVYDLVCRVYRSRYAQRVAAAGVDEDDGQQAVCLGMITRARSPGSRWNPARAGLARWVYVVTESIVGHIEQAQRRGKRQFDLSDDGAFDPPTAVPPEGADIEQALARLSSVFDLIEEREMAYRLAAGESLREAAAAMSIDLATADELRTRVRALLAAARDEITSI